MAGESGVTHSIIDELHSWDTQGDQMKGKNGALEVSLMKFILRESREIKLKVKVVLLKVSLMTFILRICKVIKWQVKVV